MGHAGTPKRPELRGDCIFLVFLLCFSFSFAFVSLLVWVFRSFPESAYHGEIWEEILGGFWGAYVPGRHPGKTRYQWGLLFSGVFVAFLVFCCFCFFVGVSLSSLCPLAPLLFAPQTRGRLTRSVVDPAARSAERKPLTGRDRETKKQEKTRKTRKTKVLRAVRNRGSENTCFT